jgi:hypothetical protein
VLYVVHNVADRLYSKYRLEGFDYFYVPLIKDCCLYRLVVIWREFNIMNCGRKCMTVVLKRDQYLFKYSGTHVFSAEQTYQCILTQIA